MSARWLILIGGGALLYAGAAQAWYYFRASDRQQSDDPPDPPSGPPPQLSDTNTYKIETQDGSSQKIRPHVRKIVHGLRLALHRMRVVRGPCRNVLARDALSESQLRVKIMMAGSSEKLDLSDCELSEVPAEVFSLHGLRELSLAGNNITQLPPDIGALTNLERFVIAGNHLQSLPDEIMQLTELVGLWAHGNTLHSLPPDWSPLSKLQTLSLAGNALEQLPCSIVSLSALTELNIAGNQIEELPNGLQGLQQLKKLIMHGNQLRSLPATLGALPSLQVLHAMGNKLENVPDALVTSASLEIVNLADNALTGLPQDWASMSRLASVLLYGNKLTSLPPSLAQLPNLRTAWLEGNPLEPGAATAFLAAVPEGSALARIGFGADQLPAGAVTDDGADADGFATGGAGSAVRVGVMPGEGGRGYFKLQPGPGYGSPEVRFDSGDVGQRCLLVAFGSAPGEPNWGGVVSHVRASSVDAGQQQFDVLYVVDAQRSWYDGGDDAAFQYWYQQLEQAVKPYQKVVMLGDSMGASAALMFAPLATAVVAFCPQVDLNKSSIRPGKNDAWFAALQQRLMQNVAASDADIQVYTGTWEHDLGQAKLLPSDNVTVHVEQFDSHRLAFYLNSQDKLVPLIRNVLGDQMGYSANRVRLANLL